MTALELIPQLLQFLIGLIVSFFNFLCSSWETSFFIFGNIVLLILGLVMSSASSGGGSDK